MAKLWPVLDSWGWPKLSLPAPCWFLCSLVSVKGCYFTALCFCVVVAGGRCALRYATESVCKHGGKDTFSLDVVVGSALPSRLWLYSFLKNQANL